ncbi:MAG: DUF2256 domain-containing protein [Gemmatimonadaceae bacterium]|nr:DUF2256 domain-containing protein [Gemmatimonadaceae bacterium]
MRKKSELPVKDCRACGRPFTWRKKWERDWDSVLFCSDACRSRGSSSSRPHSPARPKRRSPN